MDVGLALRAQRRALRMSQRGFAHDVSLSASQVAPVIGTRACYESRLSQWSMLAMWTVAA